jgi:uncharacterized heparinase superfamily protein
VKGALRRALLYVRTVRRLRWEQVAYRPLRRVQRWLPAPAAPRGEPDPGRMEAMAAALAAWGPGDAPDRLARADEVAAGSFTFVGRTEAMAEPEWTRRRVSHLWSYHLHYFAWGVDLAWAWRLTGDERFAARFRALAEGWMAACPPGTGDGWEPYALSVRIESWARALLLFGERLDAGFRAALLASLHAQAAWLERRLELHLLANHLQKNLTALVTAGLLFRGAAAARWRTKGAARLWRELAEQVLDDGGHYERSPMYHLIAASDFLETIGLLEAAGEAVPSGARARVGKMVEAIGVLCRPDGRLHLFNDAAEGEAPPAAHLAALGERLVGARPMEARGAFSLPHTGYFGWANPAGGERILVDCGPPGPVYQPGHAHCDLLSFELDLGGAPLVVDAGVSGYEGDPLREYARSTRAHNTVSIGGREQSEVWGTFRLARRAEVAGAVRAAATADGGWRFEGAYRPYHDRGAVHRRTVERSADGWRVTDRVEGARGDRLRAWLHLHPDWAVEADGSGFTARRPGTAVRIEPFGADAVRTVRGEGEPAQGWHCPRFGVALPAPVVEMTVHANDGRAFGCTIRLLNG